MTTTIKTNAEYRQALDRLDALRAEGGTPENDAEAAKLEAAIAHYETENGGPDESKGRPNLDQDV